MGKTVKLTPEQEAQRRQANMQSVPVQMERDQTELQGAKHKRKFLISDISDTRGSYTSRGSSRLHACVLEEHSRHTHTETCQSAYLNPQPVPPRTMAASRIAPATEPIIILVPLGPVGFKLKLFYSPLRFTLPFLFSSLQLLPSSISFESFCLPRLNVDPCVVFSSLLPLSISPTSVYSLIS